MGISNGDERPLGDGSGYEQAGASWKLIASPG